MSIENTNVVDGIALINEKDTLILLIADHLNWDEESKHLLLLQDKINAYLEFIDDEQYVSIYPETHIEDFEIEIHFKNMIINKCEKFLEVVNNQIKEMGVTITWMISEQ